MALDDNEDTKPFGAHAEQPLDPSALPTSKRFFDHTFDHTCSRVVYRLSKKSLISCGDSPRS
ncbi:MAG: hypothetical protein RSG59_09965, partial [Ruthenibacterium sp.]